MQIRNLRITTILTLIYLGGASRMKPPQYFLIEATGKSLATTQIKRDPCKAVLLVESKVVRAVDLASTVGSIQMRNQPREIVLFSLF